MSEGNKIFFQLQKYDLNVFSIEEKLLSIKSELNIKLGMPDLEKKLNSINEKLEEQKKIQIKINQLINENDDEINNLNTTLYSGKIRNNKEVEAIENELNIKTETSQSLIPKQNKVLENVNKLIDLKENFELKILTLQEKWIDLEKKLTIQINQLEDAKNNVQSKRKVLSVEADKKTLNLYEMFIFKNKQIGISRLENKTSSCCKIELPNAFIEKIKSNDLPIVCNCGKSLISQ